MVLDAAANGTVVELLIGFGVGVGGLGEQSGEPRRDVVGRSVGVAGIGFLGGLVGGHECLGLAAVVAGLCGVARELMDVGAQGVGGVEVGIGGYDGVGIGQCGVGVAFFGEDDSAVVEGAVVVGCYGEDAVEVVESPVVVVEFGPQERAVVERGGVHGVGFDDVAEVLEGTVDVVETVAYDGTVDPQRSACGL